MKEKIEENRQLIEKKKQFKVPKHEEDERPFPISTPGVQARPAERLEGLGVGKGFRLDFESWGLLPFEDLFGFHCKH